MHDAIFKIAGLDPGHQLKDPLEPRTERQWINFVLRQAKFCLVHMHEHDAKWTFAGNTHKELLDAYESVLGDRLLNERAREEHLRNIQRQIGYMVEKEDTRNSDAWSPVERIEREIRSLAVRETVCLVCAKYRVSDRDRDVFIRSALDEEDAQRVADDMLDGKCGHLYTIVCRVGEKIRKHGREFFKRGLALAEARKWRQGA